MNSLVAERSVDTIFCLTQEQTRYLFSLEKLLVQNDIVNSKIEKRIQFEKQWLQKWKEAVEKGMSVEGTTVKLIDSRHELIEALKKSLNESKDKIWYHLIILEAVIFRAYYPLDSDDDKEYGKLSYASQTEYLKEFISSVGYDSPDMVKRYETSYEKSLNIAMGKIPKTLTIVTLLTGTLSIPLMIPLVSAIVGVSSMSLSGAAMAHAWVAAIGGGVALTGGIGTASGITSVICGGILLGIGNNGSFLSNVDDISKKTPGLVLSQAVKLNVVLQEIILKEQNNIELARHMTERYKILIGELNKKLKMLQLEQKPDKTEMKNIKMVTAYLEALYKDMCKAVSAYEV